MIIPANPDLCDYLTAKLKRRNKLIKMADRSVLVGILLPSTRMIQALATQTMERRSDKPRTGYLPNGKVKNLTNLSFKFPLKNPDRRYITAPAPHPPHTPCPKQRNSRFASNNLPKYFRRAKC